MLSVTNRLKLPVSWNRSPDYQFRTNFFKLISKNTGTSEEPKIGFIVTTKVGKATVRNRLKRKLSEFIRPHLANLRVGTEIVIIFYPQASGTTNEELSASLDKALSKILVSSR